MRTFDINKIKAVIFDLDGTLVNSMWLWEAVDIEFMGNHGDVMPDDLRTAIEGLSMNEVAIYMKNRFGYKETIDEMVDIWNTMAYDKYRYEVPAKDNVINLIKLLKSKGIKLGIATSNSAPLCFAALESNEMKDYFDYIKTNDGSIKGKPAPDVYLMVAKELEVDPAECLVFEDIVPGIMAGKSAGMTVCAVDDDYSANMWEEKKEMADMIVRNYSEIIEMFEKE